MVKINGTKYKLDGFAVINGKNTAFEFDGCFWHGCEKCYPNSENINPRTGKTFSELQNNTIKRRNNLIEAGYTVIYIRECEFNKNQKFLNKFTEESPLCGVICEKII